MHGQDSPLKFELIRVNSKFPLIYSKIYCDKLELKIKHNWGHAILLNLNTTIMNSIFAYKLFNKIYIYFFKVRRPHLSSNIPPKIFYGPRISSYSTKVCEKKKFYHCIKRNFFMQDSRHWNFQEVKEFNFQNNTKKIHKWVSGSEICQRLFSNFLMLNLIESNGNNLTILPWKNLNFTEFSTKIHWNNMLAASDVFRMFTQSIKFF